MPFNTIDFNRPSATPKPRRGKRWLFILAGLAAVFAIGFYIFADRPAEPASSQPAASATAKPSPQPPAFDKQQLSNDKPDSLWVIVNKRRPLQPVDFAPQVTTPNVPLRLPAGTSEMTVSNQMAPALEAMFAGAKQAGLQLMVASGYRSYAEQVSVYGNEVKRNGAAEADRQSARPGHSEHQTGLAADIEPASRQCEIQACFGDLPEGKWLAANAADYGFVIRYANGKEPLTGYLYEPWHVRYVGKELAQELRKQGNPPLEVFYVLGAAPTYQ